MYLFSRSRHLKSASARESIASAIEGAGLVKNISGMDFSVWTTFASPDVGRLVWSAMFEHLDDLQAAGQTLGESVEWNDWIESSDALYDGPSEDSLIHIVHGAPDPDRTVNFVAVTTALCANGKVAAGMAAGVEIAETATKITGIPVSFGALETGPFGGVVWFSGAESMRETEEATAALATDPSWVQLVDSHGATFQTGAGSAWYQRLG
jgi:hypothetical protein